MTPIARGTSTFLAEQLKQDTTARVIPLLVTGITAGEGHQTMDKGNAIIPILDVHRLRMLVRRIADGSKPHFDEFLADPILASASGF